ncbi:YsnF/AvaK domain-containing protein [Bacillus sp. ISL-47]|uniref:YsnF/AvaK domain-containing protein n=1 Tax=Bacillus sp. ISL-47 TaxID=2819130 RepID=UPI001BEA6A47|nr:YsnF/AvaK domain-containing protein [Bacillus sp. ISL-47]MBT2687549.1 YsnF/AvaK domain-containing protein [Bacillus sp. ISL-47]MBT2706455.1 YsnF/AvaK domain-containing protein [Pseudomonas sp. ISL-84]
MDANIIGVYNSQREVVDAIQELQNDGYPVQDLSIIAQTEHLDSSLEDKTGVHAETFETKDRDSSESAGFLNSLTSWFDDGSTNQGSTVEKFRELGMSDDEASKYETYVNEGKIILYSDRIDTATGFTGGTTEARMNSTYTDGYDQRNGLTEDEEQSLKLREEQMDVTKDRVQAGEVEVHKDVVEEQKTVNVPVEHEEVYVERRKVDDPTAASTSPIGEDETIRIPITEERVEVSKKPVVTDEVVVGKREVQETQQVTENLKKEEVHLDGGREYVSDEKDMDRPVNRKDNDKW